MSLRSPWRTASRPVVWKAAGAEASCGSGCTVAHAAAAASSNHEAARRVRDASARTRTRAYGWYFAITASSVSCPGFSDRAARQILVASSRWPLFHNASPKCAAISGSWRAA